MTNRNINNYETIDGDLILSEINNKILATDNDGLVYGIENNTGKYLKDIDGSGTYEFSTVTINDIVMGKINNMLFLQPVNSDLLNQIKEMIIEISKAIEPEEEQLNEIREKLRICNNDRFLYKFTIKSYYD